MNQNADSERFIPFAGEKYLNFESYRKNGATILDESGAARGQFRVVWGSESDSQSDGKSRDSRVEPDSGSGACLNRTTRHWNERNYGTYGIHGIDGKKRIFPVNSVNSICSVVSLMKIRANV
jgi:hypothetical protein